MPLNVGKAERLASI